MTHLHQHRPVRQPESSPYNLVGGEQRNSATHRLGREPQPTHQASPGGCEPRRYVGICLQQSLDPSLITLNKRSQLRSQPLVWKVLVGQPAKEQYVSMLTKFVGERRNSI